MKTKSTMRVFILKLILPIVVLFFLANTINIISDLRHNQMHRAEIQESLNSELRSFVELQYASLQVIEQSMEAEMLRNSNIIVNAINESAVNPENVDLFALRDKLGVDTSLCDLYIINRDGVIVNTTYKSDLYFSFANFGQNHILYLYECFRNKEFVTPAFFFDSKSERYRKYSYHPTADGRYIVEIGYYSPLADEIYSYVSNFMKNRALETDWIVEINQYAYLERPKSFNIKSQFPREHYSILHELKEKREMSILQTEDGNQYIYNYLFDNLPYGISDGIIIGIKTKAHIGLAQFDNNIIQQIIVDIFFLILIIIVFIVSVRQWNQKSEIVITAIENIAEAEPQRKLPIEGRGDYPRLVSNINNIIENIGQYKSNIQHIKQQLNFASHRVFELQESVRIQQQMLDNTRVDENESLNYIRKIEQALMPKQQDFIAQFPQSFIYHKQRLPVGGNFFWHTAAEGKNVIVVADCSGNALSSAFLSIIGITILNNIVRVQNVTVPALILDKLDLALKDLFSDNQYFCEISMAVCTIDTALHQFTFSSANMPITTISNGVIQMYKGGNFAIGDDIGISKVFNNIDITYDSSSTFYLSTKGYLSQFDATDSKKLNYSNFRKLLASISTMPIIEQQKTLDNYLLAWRGKTPQTDDILIVGFKC